MNIRLLALCALLVSDLPGRTACADEAQPTYHYAEAAKYSEQLSGHAVLIMIDGNIVFEEYQNGYSADRATHIHSATKSFWGPVAAAMIADGLVSSFDEKVSDTIVEWKKDSNKNQITIRELLNLTAGLKQDTRALRGQGLTSDMYEYAIGLGTESRPGEKFHYGPATYYALGALISRKIQGKYEDPLAYLTHRILDPLGIRIADWERDAAGNPHMPAGAYLTARDWARYGQFLLQGGNWEGKQIIPRDLLEQCLRPSATFPGYGLTFWLNYPRGYSERMPSSSETAGGVIYPYGRPDIYGALGAGTNDLLVVPSLHMVIVHQSEFEGVGTRRPSSEEAFSRAKFLNLLFTGEVGSLTEPEIRESGSGQRGSRSSHSGDAFARLDRNQDGRISMDEIPDKLTRIKDNFSQMDRNHDGYLTPDEVGPAN